MSRTKWMVGKLTIVGVVVLTLALVSGWWWARRANSRGPATTSEPRQITGISLYVDEQACAHCHAAHARGHRETGHADTFHHGHDMKIVQALAGQTFEDRERGYTYHYHVDDQQGLSVSVPQRFGEDRFPLNYALGSGQHALTLLSLIPDRLGETIGIEHRVTLYRGSTGWELDLTPGHLGEVPQQEVEHFGKLIRGDKLTSCISCHTTTAEIVGQELHGLRANVGCQSCHGPGREHVIAQEQGLIGGYVGFTKQSAREEIERCGECHRLPNDDGAADPSPDNVGLVRFQSVGLLQSACFQRSGENLRCSDCHDPHAPVVRAASHYEQRCLSCHGTAETTRCPVSPSADCVSCHMPPVTIHRDIAFHDHWIRVRPPVTPETSDR